MPSKSFKKRDIYKFVEVYMEAYRNEHDKTWVATRCAITPTAVSQRINKLRNLGVNLPGLVPTNKITRDDVEALQLIVARMSNKQSDFQPAGMDEIANLPF